MHDRVGAGSVVAAEPAEVLATLRRCAAIGPFFTVETGSGDPGWQSGTALLEPTEELSAAIDAVRRWGDTEPRVAASLLVMSYTGRLLSAAVASVLLGGVLPDLRARHLHWRYRAGEGMRLRLTTPAGWWVAPEHREHTSRAAPGSSRNALLAMLGTELLGDLAGTVRAVRAIVPVSERLLWGNAASSVAGALAVLAAAGAVPPNDCCTAGDLLLSTPYLLGTGHFTGPDGLRFRRRSCCLYYRLPSAGGALCADCVLPAREPRPGRR